MLNNNQVKKLLLVVPITGLLSTTSLAQNDLNNLILATSTNQVEEVLTGNTGGSYSLASIANRDSKGNPCMGYGDPKPDHVMTLKSDFEQLSLKIDSNQSDTTLLIKSESSVRCAFGKDNVRDAVINGRNWSAGTYSIWIGSISPNQRSQYRLLVQS